MLLSVALSGLTFWFFSRTTWHFFNTSRVMASTSVLEAISIKHQQIRWGMSKISQIHKMLVSSAGSSCTLCGIPVLSSSALLEPSSRFLRIFWKCGMFLMSLNLPSINLSSSRSVPGWFMYTEVAALKCVFRCNSGRKLRGLSFLGLGDANWLILFQEIELNTYLGLFLLVARVERLVVWKALVPTVHVCEQVLLGASCSCHTKRNCMIQISNLHVREVLSVA